MADVPSSAEKRFSEHLRRIREARDISVATIHSETQIPRTLIDSFENAQLYEHPSYNRVYLRSFVKAYSEAIGISRDQALTSLQSALEGTYEDALAEQYLSDSGAAAEQTEDESPSFTEEEQTPSAGGASGRGGIVGPPRAVGEEEEPSIDEVASPDANVRGKEEEANASAEEAAAREEEPDSADRDAADDVAETAPSTVSEEDAPPDAPSDEEPISPSHDPSEEGPVEDDSDSGESSDSDVSADEARDKLEEMSGPEALRSTPDEEDEQSDTEASVESGSDTRADAGPSWMQGDDDSADASGTASPAGGEPDVSGTEGTGIVGEPSALGGGEVPAEEASPPGTSSPQGRRSAQSLFSDPSRQVLATGLGIVVVLLVLIGVGIAYFRSGDPATETATPAAPSPPATDTAAAGASPDTTTSPADVDDTDTPDEESEAPPPADVSLGKQINLLIYATDPITSIKVQRDDDLRRPYWIEDGEASVFPFERRVVVQRQLDNAELYVEGYRYPVASADTTGGLELTRSQLEAFVDTLRGSPASLSVSPDTVQVGSPAGAPESDETTEEEPPTDASGA